jgi:nitroimidazol reductase NimA-like FMN-containing flavoprotein (pyridoxamine 5'-phosphate oxidase superfamily)
MTTFRDAHSGLEMLERKECLRLLAAHDVGRLAVVDAGRPVIFPVNYVLDGETVVFRTDSGTKLEASRRAPVAFEIDELDPDRHEGWSVVVLGYAEEISVFDPPRVRRLQWLPLHPWAGGEKAHWVRIVPVTISGRQIKAESRV